jgi:GT2 family glycosyltransferase
MTACIDTVIVAYNSEDVIEDSVRVAGALGGITVVVDHGDGESAELAATAGATVIWDPSNPGFGTGQNRGIEATTSQFVLLCNPDAAIDPDAVRAGVGFLESKPCVAAVQGVIVNRATGKAERSHGVALRPIHLVGRSLGARRMLNVRAVRHLARRSSTLRDHADRVPSTPVEVESLAATVLLMRRSAFEAVGGFDSSFFLYGEDLDLSRRLREAGWRLVALPEPWAVHESGGSASSDLARELDWWRGTLQYGAMCWTPGQWGVAMVAAVAEAIRISCHAPRAARSVWSSVVTSPIRVRRDGRMVKQAAATARDADGPGRPPALRQ